MRSETRGRVIRSALMLLTLTLTISAVWAVPASAQVTSTVLGTVKDQQGGAVPGAPVVLISESRGTRSEAVFTNMAGDFTMPNVVPDTYTVQVEMQSVKILKRIDKSSPQLANALCANQVIDATFKFFRPNPTGDGTIVEDTTSIYRGDRYELIVDSETK